MTVAETVLVYVGAPLAVFLVFAALIYIPGGRRRPRWKSGQPWDHEPLWWGPRPEHPVTEDDDDDDHGGGRAALPAGAAASRALTSGSDDHEVPARLAGGPLGGARGTW